MSGHRPKVFSAALQGMRFSVRKLSTRRRHPLAGIVVMLLALGVVGGVYSAVAPEPAKAETVSKNDVEAGRKLFLIGCASCHGKNAERHRDQARRQLRALPDRRRRCRGRLPGRHRTHADGQVRSAGSRSRTPSTPPRRPGSSLPTSRRWPPDRRSRTTSTPTSPARPPSRSVRAASSSAPTARPATTRSAPAAPCPAASTPPSSTASAPSTSPRP